KRIYLYLPEKDIFSVAIEIKEGDINNFLIDPENDNLFWMAATNEGGLVKYNKKTGVSKYFIHEPGDESTISNNIVMDLVKRNNNIWITTYGGGINKIDIATNKVTRYPIIEYY